MLKEYETQQVEFSETEKFKSHFGKFEINGAQVEIMGELQNKNPVGDLWGETGNFSGKIDITYKDLVLPAVSLEDEYLAYTKMGRAEKAGKILEKLESKNTAQ